MTVANSDEDREFEDLLLMLKETRGFDFTGYKRSTLIRRVRRRMDARKLMSIGEYRDYLELEPEEFARLFDSLLINVTGFFRDPPAWQSLRELVLPELLTARGGGRPLRIWSAGCATGEEAYTLAIVLAEAMGTEEFLGRVKIYATDLDEDALTVARAGAYSERQVTGVTEEQLAKYFEPTPGGTKHTFRRDLRRQVIFGRNDLTRDAPISRVDLLVARNTLMYFNAETQSNVIRKFHFALNDPGFLFLGKAEMLLNHSSLFEPFDLRKRLFRKLSTRVQQEAPPMIGLATAPVGEYPATHEALEAAALAAAPVAQLVVDRFGRLAAANVRAESLFNLRPRDLGSPFQDLEVSYRPVELRSVIEHVTSDQRPVELSDVEWRRAGAAEPSYFDVNVVPLYRSSDEPVGVAISFADVTGHRQMRVQLEHANHELENAYEELRSLNEELETTNEELQSTNEELETTNEELQSTNEELETMNEELQSTNDELQTVNDILRLRSEELNASQAFLTSVLGGLGAAVIVVDQNLRVKVWDPGAEELWGVRSEEAIGKPVDDLDIGLPMAEVMPLLRNALTGRPERTQTIIMGTNRRGRSVHMHVETSLLRNDKGAPDGALVTMNHVPDD
jgi:two-component system CheB/CheR fusion protein